MLTAARLGRDSRPTTRVFARTFLVLLVPLAFGGAAAADTPTPNILWLSSEDHGPHLGCYGDTYATTPHIDSLASRGMIYLHCWSCAPVCAPARTTIISGLYPPSTGAEHMRSLVAYPQGKAMFPQLLREAGYYCTNNAKEDYNLAQPGQVWDDSSNKGHWRNRKPGQPFFAVFNSVKSHESQIRTRPHQAVHDPAKVRVPTYHPDTPEVRKDWAQYYDKITEAEADAGARLKELADDGLAEDTIVFYWADHGSGMPRSKRWPFDSGLHVPLVVYIPPKFQPLAPPDYRPGGRSDRLVSFVDFAPTMLSLAGIRPPEWLQGHAFMGRHTAEPQPFVYGFRGRMDERYDLVRTVTDGRFVYVRNYMPHKIYGQHIEYMFQTPTTRVWKSLHDEGKLNPVQNAFWNTKPAEELYDLRNDPDEVINLVGKLEYEQTLKRLRGAQQNLGVTIRDVGFLPEGELHSRSERSTPFDTGHDDQKYPMQRVFEAAELASLLRPEALPALRQGLRNDDSAVRYWAAMGVLMRGRRGVESASDDLRVALNDRSPYVRVVAAEALAEHGSDADLKRGLAVLVEHADAARNTVFVAMAALNALDALGEKAAPIADAVQKLPKTAKVPDPRYEPYVPRLTEDLAARFRTGGTPGRDW